VADDIGIKLYPWQRTAARYLTAKGRGETWLYRHVAIVVARQSGKTTLLVPLIVQRLRAGHRIMHTAQDRNLPREIHDQVSTILAQHPNELARRGHKVIMPRYSSGQEEIRMANGGIYSIVAPTRGGARGPARDLVIIDELREMDTTDFIAAATPTLQASRHPQMVYLSNAGDDTSTVLNSLKASAEEDPSLAYLEWSAAPERAVDDLTGWAEANPSIGHDPSALDNLAADYQTHKARGTLAIFETENLCRWVASLNERLVDGPAWLASQVKTSAPVRPSFGMAMDPDGRRASLAVAWMEGFVVRMELLMDVVGSPLDITEVGDMVAGLERRHNAKVGYDPRTDAPLFKYVRKGHGEIVNGQKHAAASAEFARLVSLGRLQWSKADAVTDDLTWTVRDVQGPDGSFAAAPANDRPITASLAAIRAVWLASMPATAGRLVVR
jgi:hypothetical protein